MSSNIADQATAIYVFVDDFLKANPTLTAWRTSNNDTPAFSDAEVIAIGLMQGSLGVATLRKTYQMIRDNIPEAFPRLPCYKQWLRRLHQVSFLVGHLVQAALAVIVLSPLRLYLLDSKPIPVCKPIRHGRVRLLTEDGAYFGKTSAGWFFGFKLHLITHVSGPVIATVLTPGNWDDRPAALALTDSTGGGGVVLGDGGYSGEAIAMVLREEVDMVLVRPRDAPWGSAAQQLLSAVRERVETTLRQLWDRFADRVYARSWQGLWSVLLLKVAHVNLCYAGIASI
jgi:transposase